MSFRTLTPALPLLHLVESIWDHEAAAQEQSLERVMPTANACLIINLAEDESRVYDPDTLRCRRFSGFTLDGPRCRFSIIDTAEQAMVMGVVFRPGGAAHFFRERLDCLLNRYVDVEDLLGPSETTRLREQLLEAGTAEGRLAILNEWLVARVRHAAKSAEPLTHALAILDSAPHVDRIAALAHACDLSPRRFRKLFGEQVGMSPKRYVRLQRFHRVLSSSFRHRDVDWAAVAADCGFHDQSHLIHEFRAFSGADAHRLPRPTGPASQSRATGLSAEIYNTPHFWPASLDMYHDLGG